MKFAVAILLFACAGLCLAQSDFSSQGRKLLVINKESSEVTVVATPEENSNLTNRFALKFSLQDYPSWTLSAYEGSQFVLPPNNDTNETSTEESKLFEFNFLFRRLAVFRDPEEVSGEESGEEASEESSDVIASTDKACFPPNSRISAQLNMRAIRGLWSDIEESSEDAEGSDGNPIKIYTFSSEISLPFGGTAMIKTHLADAPVRFQGKVIGPGRCKIDLVLNNVNVPPIFNNLINNTTKVALLSVLRADQPVDEFSLGEEDRKSLIFNEKGEIDWFDMVMTEQENGQLDSATVGKYQWITQGEPQRSEEDSEEGSEQSLYGVAFCFSPEPRETTVRNFTWGPYLEIYDSEESSIEVGLGESSEEGSEESSQP